MDDCLITDIEPMWLDPEGHDKWLWENVFNKSTEGLYLELYSGHGLHGSPTYAFEQLGWKGLCIDPWHFDELQYNRKCHTSSLIIEDAHALELSLNISIGMSSLDLVCLSINDLNMINMILDIKPTVILLHGYNESTDNVFEQFCYNKIREANITACYSRISNIIKH